MCKLRHPGLFQQLCTEVLPVKLVAGIACGQVFQMSQRGFQPLFFKTRPDRL